MAIELTEKYLTEDAKEQAKLFSDKGLDKNQLRKFYDEFLLIDRKINDNVKEDKFKTEILPYIKFIKSKIAYNAGRKANNKILIPKEFKDYMYGEIDKINTIKDFKNFLLHYQAIIGYFTYINEVEKNNQGAKR